MEMTELHPARPFQHRFLDGYDRSQLRQEVQKVPPTRLKGLRKKTATWALGASLALGGLGVPMKIVQNAQSQGERSTATQNASAEEAVNPAAQASQAINSGITQDQAQSQSIADQVAGGVRAATNGVVNGIETVARAPLQEAVQAPQQLTSLAEQVKQKFFNTQVPFGSIIYSEAKKNDLPPELVAAVVHTESQFKPTARSNRGAIGLMQLEPRTGRWMGAHNLANPAENISAGAKYLRYLTDRFNGDQQKAIAAYNAGEGSVRRFNGVPPFRETRNYVSRVRNFQQDLGDQQQGQVADLGTGAALR